MEDSGKVYAEVLTNKKKKERIDRRYISSSLKFKFYWKSMFAYISYIFIK